MNKSGIVQVGAKDIFWSYFAVCLQIGSGILLYPIILYKLPSEIIAVWTIFLSITSLTHLVDFGFSSSFTRNLTYIFSGVKELKAHGLSEERPLPFVDDSLLKSTISAMKRLYSRMALVVFIFLAVPGTFYFWSILKNFSGDKTSMFIVWWLFCIVNTYNIYTLYYDSLLMGRGLIKRDRQIVVLSQITYLTVSVLLLLNNLGLLSIVVAQAVSLLLKRILSYRVFFSNDIRERLNAVFVTVNKKKEIIRTLFPNALKLGLTSIGAYLVLQSASIIGPLYIPLDKFASYGITLQLINVVSSISGVYSASYMPKVSQLRINNNVLAIRSIYLKSVIIEVGVFVIGAVLTILLGNKILHLLCSKTLLLDSAMLSIFFLIAFLEKNHAIAGSFLVTKNEVPYFKAALISGAATVALLFILLQWTDAGIWAMILAPGIVQLAYQNWRWPLMLLKELKA